jgi:hypothetical protein
MDYRSALAIESIDQVEPKLLKLTNPFKYERPPPVAVKPRSFSEIVMEMRQRWEAYHEQNGTWYDYSDDGSWYSEEEEEEEEPLEDDDFPF